MESSGSYGIYVSGYLIPPKIDKHYAYLSKYGYILFLEKDFCISSF